MICDYAGALVKPSSLDRREITAPPGGVTPPPNLNAAQSEYQSAMTMREAITAKLTAAFTPDSLRVEDESHLHEGHAGHRPGGETHYRIYIVSGAFRGKSRLDRHRMINATLNGELKGGVHALAIHAQAPGEST